MRWKSFPDGWLVPIVNDGAIATRSLGDGRLVPLLVIDCSSRPEVRDLIFVHEHSPPGDVDVTWGTARFSKDKVYLHLHFQRPSNIDVLLEFDVLRHGVLIDGILHAHGVYLQPLESGRSVTEGLDKHKILAEIPDTGFLPHWKRIFEKKLKKKFKHMGLARAQVSETAKEHMRRMGDLWRVRMGRAMHVQSDDSTTGEFKD